VEDDQTQLQIVGLLLGFINTHLTGNYKAYLCRLVNIFVVLCNRFRVSVVANYTDIFLSIKALFDKCIDDLEVINEIIQVFECLSRICLTLNINKNQGNQGNQGNNQNLMNESNEQYTILFNQMMRPQFLDVLANKCHQEG